MSTHKHGNDINDLTLCSACCCMLTGLSFKYPDCFGCGVNQICVCIKQDYRCCSLMDERKNEEGRMFVCSEGGCFLVQPTTCIAAKTQCCCIDERCAIPCTQDVPCMCTLLPGCALYPKFGCCAKVKDLKEVPPDSGIVNQAENKAADLSDTPIEEVMVCQACCCSICGFFCQFPQCLGAKMEGSCVCLNCEESCCKVIKEENEAGICCICVDGGSYVVMPRTCIEFTETFFCLDSRCAIPCTDKVPCICTFLPGCTLCASKEMNIKCFPKVGDLLKKPAQVQVM